MVLSVLLGHPCTPSPIRGLAGPVDNTEPCLRDQTHTEYLLTCLGTDRKEIKVTDLCTLVILRTRGRIWTTVGFHCNTPED